MAKTNEAHTIALESLTEALLRLMEQKPLKTINVSELCDKAGVSREKLSYIVDSTAAPLAGIAVISSWVAVEVSVIQEGLDMIGSNTSAFQIFLASIPYCFYCIFALVFVYNNKSFIFYSNIVILICLKSISAIIL